MRCFRCNAEIEKSFRACPHCGEAISDFLRAHYDTPVDGKYRILERLGSGGMGDVYKVEHIFLGAIRVIKVIRPQISGSADAHERFLREARLATRVQHPNVAVMHDFAALPDGSHYMVWEYIDGENLGQLIRKRGTLPPREAIRIAVQALRGLDAIHRAGIIHRDIGPENLMITRDSGMVKIIDLGVAKEEDGDVAVTRTGIFVGKLRYASPEQLGFLPEKQRIDARADLYSLGMVLYEMLAGRPPFEGKSPHEYLRIHSEETAMQLVDLSRDLPGDPTLQAILRRALARDRNKRFQTAAEFANALEQAERTMTDLDTTMRQQPATVREAAPTIRTPLPESTQPRSSRALLILIVAIVVVAVATAFWLTRERPAPPQETAIVEAPRPAQTNVNVVATTTTAIAETPRKIEPAPPTTTTAALVAPITHTIAPAPTPPPREDVVRQVPTPSPVPLEVATPTTYVEGGNGDTNGPLLDRLRSQLHGVTRIALQAGAMQDDVAKALKHEISNLTIADNADVVIRFDGTLEHLGRGRKRRAARASVVKNGRVIFRYEMPDETYRVGDTPAEAFAAVMSNAFER